MVVPQGVLPPQASPSTTPANPAVPAPVRAPIGACFNCGHNGHFVRECLNRDQARIPAVPPELGEAVKVTTEDIAERVAESCSGVCFCVNCGMVDHVASQCTANPVSDDFAYSRCATRRPPMFLQHMRPCPCVRP